VPERRIEFARDQEQGNCASFDQHSDVAGNVARENADGTHPAPGIRSVDAWP
jgi:hypothetical protein